MNGEDVAAGVATDCNVDCIVSVVVGPLELPTAVRKGINTQ